jgi:hypothetical protein
MNEQNYSSFICLLPTALLLSISSAEPQQAGKVPRIGMLVSGSVSRHDSRVEASGILKL